MMDIKEAEKLVSEKLENAPVEYIEDAGKYFIVKLKTDQIFDSCHMINKETKIMEPYNPILMK